MAVAAGDLYRVTAAGDAPPPAAPWQLAKDGVTPPPTLRAATARVAQILAEVGLGASTDEVWAEASRTVAQGGSSAHGV